MLRWVQTAQLGLATLCLQNDLVQTIGVSAALGAAGVVLWGDLSFSSSKVIIIPFSLYMLGPRMGERPCQGHGARTLTHPFLPPQEKCWRLHDYLVSTLGPYVINVTRAATACSLQQCHGHGRCAWQNPGKMEAFLHLQPDGSPGAWKSFSCRCYWGWTGPTCQEPRPEPKKAL